MSGICNKFSGFNDGSNDPKIWSHPGAAETDGGLVHGHADQQLADPNAPVSVKSTPARELRLLTPEGVSAAWLSG